MGYISTPDEEKFLNSNDALTKYSRGILNAFINYKKKYFDSVPVNYKIEDVPVPKIDSAPMEDAPAEEPIARQKRESSQRDNGNSKPTQTTTASTQKSATNSQKQTSNSQKPAASQGGQKASSGKPLFKLQILAGSAKLGSTDRQFKGVSGVERIEDGDHYIYTVGSSTNYNEIYRLRKQLLDKFPDSHIIAYKNGQKMNINEAINEFKANRGR